jgi:hypothetical protein
MSWPPHREPLRRTAARTVTIALIAGAVLALSWGGLRRWPLATLMVLWFSFGGHWVELWFLNWLRPRLSGGRPAQVAGRLATWFAGGSALGLGMALTAMFLGGLRQSHLPPWWVGGVAFIGFELVVHLMLQLRGYPNFYDGRG